MDTQEVGTEVNTEVTQVERDPTEEWEVGQVSALTGGEEETGVVFIQVVRGYTGVLVVRDLTGSRKRDR